MRRSLTGVLRFYGIFRSVTVHGALVGDMGYQSDGYLRMLLVDGNDVRTMSGVEAVGQMDEATAARKAPTFGLAIDR